MRGDSVNAGLLSGARCARPEPLDREEISGNHFKMAEGRRQSKFCFVFSFNFHSFYGNVICPAASK
jgi:hypothetical protein